ncbi:MAG: alpha/beta hydrolase [Anaerolineae bacterium]|jgi:carboxylesterase|nr:alpha/beta fold hydrolase [Chloroflexota bacterium]
MAETDGFPGQRGSPKPYTLGPEEAPAGCLLVHGLTGSPAEMRPLAEHLAAQGYRCHVPLLPGHGTTVADLHRAHHEDWTATATQALDQLRQSCGRLYAIGFSMGTLVAAYLAVHNPDLAAVALLSPAVQFRNPFVPLASVLYRVMPTIDKGAPTFGEDTAEYVWAYRRWSTHGLGEMWRLRQALWPALDSVQVPALIVHSLDDPDLSTRTGQTMLAKWGAADKELLTLHHSGHAVLLNEEREQVFSTVTCFFDAHGGGAAQQ